VREISVIIPCRNDALVLRATLDALHRVVTHNSLSVETLVVDDESTDATIAVAIACAKEFAALHVRVLARKHLQPGFGGALRYGMAFAQGRYCVLLSSDGHDPVELIPALLRPLRAGKHLVQCSRFMLEEHAAAVPVKYRIYQSIYRTLTRLTLGDAVTDSTYGYRAFDRIFVQSLGLSANRFNVCPEMTFKVMLCGGSIEYVPGKPRALHQGGQSKFQLASEIWGYAYVLLRAVMHRTGLRRWF
jgi:glycosyltransferase involved in cell wall biosynthesis